MTTFLSRTERFSISNDPNHGPTTVGGRLLRSDALILGHQDVEERLQLEVLRQAHRAARVRQVCLLRPGSYQHLESSSFLRSHRQGLNAPFHCGPVQVYLLTPNCHFSNAGGTGPKDTIPCYSYRFS